MKKIAILGGTRFIGVHLLSALYKQGHEITIYNRNVSRPPISIPEEISHITGDRDSPDDLGNLFDKEFDVVFDLSGYTPRQVEPVVRNYRSNIGHYIFCSTCRVHQTNLSGTVSETSPLTYDQNTYGGNKALVEKLLLDQHENNGWPITIFRPQGVFGPYDPCPAGLIFYRLIHSLPIFISAERLARINLLFVNDLVTAFLRSIDNPVSYGKTYGIAGDDITTSVELIELCGKISSHRPILHFSDSCDLYKGLEAGVYLSEGDLVVDNNRVKKDLGLNFTPLGMALDKTFTWLKDNPEYLRQYSFSGERYVLSGRPAPVFVKAYCTAITRARRLVVRAMSMRARFRNAFGKIYAGSRKPE